MKLFLALLFALTAFVADAQDFAALRRQADTSQAQVTSPGADCNRGEGEAFAEFIVKFTTDAAFNAERSKLSGVFALKPIANYRALVTTSGHEAGYTQMWQIKSPGCVRLVCGYDGMPSDYTFVFKRADKGLWRLVDRVTDSF